MFEIFDINRENGHEDLQQLQRILPIEGELVHVEKVSRFHSKIGKEKKQVFVEGLVFNSPVATRFKSFGIAGEKASK
jgi:hypothetical protein